MDQLLNPTIDPENCLAFTVQWEKDGRPCQKTVRITPEEAVRMTDDALAYQLSKQAKPFKPRYIDGFNWVLGRYVRDLYDANLISCDIYTDFIKKRLDSDIKRYFPKPSGRYINIHPKEWYPTGHGGRISDAAIGAYNSRKDFCDDFLFYYFPEATQTRYKEDAINMIKESSHECCVALEKENMLSFKSIPVVDGFRTRHIEPENFYDPDRFMEKRRTEKKPYPITHSALLGNDSESFAGRIPRRRPGRVGAPEGIDSIAAS